MKKTLLVDFDGTLSDYHGWKGLTEVGPPLPKARKAMILLARKFKLVCFTTRSAEVVEPWLRAHGFPEMEVTNVKKPAHLIVDDRALRFNGEWTDELLREIEDFAPHWESTHSPHSSPSHSPST
jgi:hypothetical protein